MTNNELNKWYHESLGKCVHENRTTNMGTHKQKCCDCGTKTSSDNPCALDIPDHLSDPAVMWGILKEHRFHVIPHTFIDIETEKPFNSFGVGTISKGWQGKGLHPDMMFNDIVRDKSLERAVMLALKAKVEG